MTTRGSQKEELASYILAADGLARLKDATYAGWEFCPGGYNRRRPKNKHI